MTTLRLAPELALPLDAVTQTLVVYGAKGMGKTVFAAVLAEELAANHLRFALLDHMGVSWGLRHSADGKGHGIEILILGGIHGDIPIEPTAGAVVADLVADEDVSTLIDISRRPNGTAWTQGERIRFVADYCERLYGRQVERRRPLMQIIDEAARYVPQLIPHGSPELSRCVGAVERMVEEGRNIGIGIALITQRSARLNKSVSELAECMVAFRTVGPLSVDAVLDWLGAHVDKSKWKGYVEQLRALPRGSALVISPGWLDFEGVARIRMRRTFDSSATPRAGHERRASGPGAQPDLDKYRTRMAATIEKAKAEDPKLLRQEVARLTAELGKARTPRPAAAPERSTRQDTATIRRLRHELEAAMKFLVQITAHNFTETDTAEMQKAIDAAVQQALRALESTLEARQGQLEGLQRQGRKLIETMKALLDKEVEVQVDVRRNELFTVSAPVHPAQASARRQLPVVTGPGEPLKPMPRAMLAALAQHPDGLTKKQILIHTGYRASGDVSALYAQLARDRWVTVEAGRLVITAAGLEALGAFEPLPTGAALRAHLLADPSRGPMERAMLRVLFDAYPDGVTKGALLEKTGYRASGDVSAMFAKLVALGWAEKAGRGELRAAAEFFEA